MEEEEIIDIRNSAEAEERKQAVSMGMGHHEEEVFRYTYSAKEREEITRIRRKYMPREENKMDQLRRLDARVTQKGMISALTIGIISALVLGIGMCLCMVWPEYIRIGIPVGLLGIAGMCVNYPLYLRIIKKEREKLAPEILRLTEELMRS